MVNFLLQRLHPILLFLFLSVSTVSSLKIDYPAIHLNRGLKDGIDLKYNGDGGRQPQPGQAKPLFRRQPRKRAPVPRYPEPNIPAPKGEWQVMVEEPDMLYMNLGPAFDLSNCIFCPTQSDGSALDETDSEAILNHMTAQTFLRYIKGNQQALTDTCVFYTKGVTTAGAATGLSVAATEWACGESQKDRYTIWNLFPNSLDASSNAGVRDFYAMFTPNSWLDPVRLKQAEYEATKPAGIVPPSIRYFQQMSQSMAEACYGDIIIMTETPKELALYEPGKKHQDARFNNIFWSHERPVLQRKVRAKQAKLYALDSSTKEAWEIINIDTFELGSSTQFRRDLQYGNETFDVQSRAELQARANMCQSSGLGSQPLGQDWFGSYGSNGW
ncbi:NPP1 domain-containing protein [Colletotrichum tofieldiae]|nr:NPP1 domain-containing protein [Colletotrichum tofieldiae]GKT69259.1 NPP1 domain-containing protein [Colletotrichum tofieldiae]